MRLSAAILPFLVSSAGAAIAPDSISNKIYFERSDAGPTVILRTIVFRPDGRFVYLRLASGDSRTGILPVAPPADGKYTYTRTGERDGAVRLAGDDGTVIDLPLTGFSSPGSGTSSSGPARQISFNLIDADQFQRAPASNLSVRGKVEPGKPLIVGFSIPPDSPRGLVMIRVLGPSLASFGVTDPWADPDFRMFNASGAERATSLPFQVDEAHLDNWDALPASKTALERIFDYAGAFRLLPGSKEAVDVIRFRNHGAYTIVCGTKAGDPGGETLVEVYFLPN